MTQMAQTQSITSLAGQIKDLQERFSTLTVQEPSFPEVVSSEAAQQLAGDSRLPDHLKPFANLLVHSPASLHHHR